MKRWLAGLVILSFTTSQVLGARTLQRVAAPRGQVQNVSFEQIAGGVINIYYDLISDSADAAYSVNVTASDDGGRTFNLKPSAITGDVTNVKPGTRKKIVWRSGQDVAALAIDQLRFQVVPTFVPTTTAVPDKAAPPPDKGGSPLKLIIPIAGGAAAVAALFLLKKKDDTTPPVPTCNFAVAPSSLTLTKDSGSSATLDVSVTPANCAPNSWTASGSGFVTVSPASGNGAGTITVTASSANTGTSPRSTTVTVAGQTITVNQAPPTGCTFDAAPKTISLDENGGGTKTVSVTATPAGCSPNTWTAAITNAGTPVNFLSGLAPTSGTAGQSFSFSASVNTGAARNGTITVTPASGSTIAIAVNQDRITCTYQVSRSPSGNLGLGAQNITVSIVASKSACGWKASFSPNPNSFLKFLNMTSDGGVTASGTGTVTNLMVSVAALAAGTRSGTMVLTDNAGNASPGGLIINQQ